VGLNDAQLQCADLEYTQLQGVNLRGALVGSATFRGAKFSLNDFRGLQTLPLFTKQNFASWKTNIRMGTRQNYWDYPERWENELQSCIGKPTEWPTEALTTPCLADNQSTAPFQNCQEPKPDYYKVLIWFPSSCLGALILQAPAWPFFGKPELQKPHSQAGAWERAKNPIPKQELGNEQIENRRLYQAEH